MPEPPPPGRPDLPGPMPGRPHAPGHRSSPDDVRVGMSFAAGAAILFGTAYVATGIALRSFDPVALAAWRGLGATAIILVVLGARRSTTLRAVRRLRRVDVGRLLLLGILTGPVFIVGMNVAVAVTGATIAAFVAGLYAVLAAVLAPFVLHERLGRRALAGFVVALVGTALLAELDVRSGSAGGILVGLGVAVVYAFYLLLSRRWSAGGRLPGDIVSFTVFFMIAVILVPLQLIRAGPSGLLPPSPRPEAVLAVVWLVSAPSALANLLIQASVRRVAARRSSALLLLNPIAAAVLAAILLGERLSATQSVGAALVLVGIALTGGFEPLALLRTGRARLRGPADPGSSLGGPAAGSADGSASGSAGGSVSPSSGSADR